MVEETIRVIRETESQADQIVKHAQDQYNKLLEEARKEADKIRTEQLQSAKQKAEQEMEAARSVSYTHLDVYKRQIRRRSSAQSGRSDKSCGSRTEDRKCDPRQYLPSVSYTHLFCIFILP